MLYKHLVGALLIAVIVPLSLSVTADATSSFNIDTKDSISDTSSRELDEPHGIAIFTHESDGTTTTYAAVTAFKDDGVQIISMANPENLTAVGHISDTSDRELDGAWGVAIFTHESDGTTTTYAAVTAQKDDGVQIISLADPANPTAVGRITDTTSRELNGASGIDIFQKDGTNYAAVASKVDDGVQIISLADPANPTAVGSIEDTRALELDGAVSIDVITISGGNYAAVAAQEDDGVQIINLADPANPTALTNIDDSFIYCIDDACSTRANADKLGTAYYPGHPSRSLNLDNPNDIRAVFADNKWRLAVASTEGIQILTPNFTIAGGSTTPVNGKVDNDEARYIAVHQERHFHNTVISDCLTCDYWYTATNLIVTYHDDKIRIINIETDNLLTGTRSHLDNPVVTNTIHDYRDRDLDNPQEVAFFEDDSGNGYLAVTAKNDDAVQLLQISAPARYW